MTKTAVFYGRTSSETNADGDSRERQALAVHRYARSQGIDVVAEFHDVVTGSAGIHERPEFTKMLSWLEANGCRTIIVSDATRFARDLGVQIVGHDWLVKQGFTLIAADHPELFVEDTPTAVLFRQMMGAFAQFEKASLVAKLRGARDRASAKLGRRVEGARWMRQQGRKYPPEHVAAAQAMRASGESLRAIAARLEQLGMKNLNGKRYAPPSIERLLQTEVTQ